MIDASVMISSTSSQTHMIKTSVISADRLLKTYTQKKHIATLPAGSSWVSIAYALIQCYIARSKR